MAIPLTPFEQRGHVTWTSLAEETAWIESLLAGSSRVTMRVAGQSSGGGPMRVFRIGTGPRTVFHLAQQHGNEVSGREAWLTTLREWAETTDPAILSYLQRVTVHVMPTCHPDNIIHRHSPADIDINRDHLRLSQPESRVIQEVIRDVRPDLIADWHEYFNQDTEYRTSPTLNVNTHPELLSLSAGMDAAVKAHVRATTDYVIEDFARIYGAELLHGQMGLHHAVGILLETPTPSSISHFQRWGMQRAGITAVTAWHAAHVDDVQAAAEASRAWAAQSRERIIIQHYGGGQATEYLLDPPPRSYRLTDAQWDDLAVHRETFGLTGYASGDDYVMTMAQPQKVLLAYVVDPNSPEKIVEGVPQGVPHPRIPIPTHYTLKFRHNGVTYPATLKVKP